MRKILLLALFQLVALFSFSQSLMFSFLNSKATTVDGEVFHEIDVMIASQSSNDNFAMSSGQLYFNYSTNAFGSNIVANGNLEVIVDDTYLLGLKDNFYDIVNVYSAPILNDNAPNRFSIAWQQDRAGICIDGLITTQPQRLCKLRIRYEAGGEIFPSGICYETDPVYTNQVYTICGPFPEDCSQLSPSDCSTFPGIQVNNEEMYCGSHRECYIERISVASGISATSCQPFGEEWIHITTALNETVFSINPKNNNLGTINATVFVDLNNSQYDGQAYMKRHYLITSEFSPTEPITVRMYFSQEEFEDLVQASAQTPSFVDDVTTISDLGVTKYNGPTEDGNLDLSDATDIRLVNPNRNGIKFQSYYIEMKMSSLSEFWIHAKEIGVLPLNLLSFDAWFEKEHVVLNWETENEKNMAWFELEKSEDAQTFKKIAKIDAVGNSIEKQNYNYRDLYPFDEFTYYRLKMVNLDGSFEYSDLLTVQRKAFSKLELYPNPVTDLLTVHYDNPYNSSFYIEIYDPYGKQIKRFEQETNGTNRIQIPTESLSNGIYILQVYDGLYSFKKRFLKIK